MKLAATACIFFNNKLLTIKHVKSGNWMHVGGHVEEGETITQALIREVKEETDLDINIIDTQNNNFNKIDGREIPPYSIKTGNNFLGFDYLAEATTNNVKMQAEEIQDYKWISEEEINNPEFTDSVKTLFKEAFRLYKSLNNIVRQ